MSSEDLRRHVLNLLRGSDAHLGVEETLRDWPEKLRVARPAGSPHTPWQLLEHMRIAQWDILEFCRNPKHVSPPFPQGYWPKTEAPPDEAAWNSSVSAFRGDLKSVCDLVADPAMELFARIQHPQAEPHHTLLREALLVADHNAYHLGQLVLLRRMLSA
jgi:hypothetical protein